MQWRVHSWTISISLRLAHVTIGVRSEESVSRFLYPTLRFLLWASGTNVPFSELVVCGDFFQLPPIDLANEGFAFEAKCWPEVIKCSVLLKQVFRQKGDTALMSILDEARLGECGVRSMC